MNVEIDFLIDLNQQLTEEQRLALVTIANMMKLAPKYKMQKEAIFRVSALTSTIIRTNKDFKTSLGNWRLLRNSEIEQ